LQDIGDELGPLLTTHQIYRLASMFNDDVHGTHGVSREVSRATVTGIHKLYGWEQCSAWLVLPLLPNGHICFDCCSVCRCGLS
jgi:hypothetical protein